MSGMVALKSGVMPTGYRTWVGDLEVKFVELKIFWKPLGTKSPPVLLPAWCEWFLPVLLGQCSSVSVFDSLSGVGLETDTSFPMSLPGPLCVSRCVGLWEGVRANAGLEALALHVASPALVPDMNP